MKLNLKRPIVFFDLETTGVDTSKDRIVEISMVKVMPDGEEIIKTRKINPQMPIPPSSTAIHGITDEVFAIAPRLHRLLARSNNLLRGATLEDSTPIGSTCRF
ncbi:MAG: 3'-5' exonuclease [Rikenellaceae bacterium]